MLEGKCLIGKPGQNLNYRIPCLPNPINVRSALPMRWEMPHRMCAFHTITPTVTYVKLVLKIQCAAQALGHLDADTCTPFGFQEATVFGSMAHGMRHRCPAN